MLHAHTRLMMKNLHFLATATLLVSSAVVLPIQARSSESSLRPAVAAQHSPFNLTLMSPFNTSSGTSSSLIAAGATTATVFDPPSHVRDRPNGKIVCTITTVRRINVYRYYDNSYQWISTDACGPGTYGVIHVSQIRF